MTAVTGGRSAEDIQEQYKKLMDGLEESQEVQDALEQAAVKEVGESPFDSSNSKISLKAQGEIKGSASSDIGATNSPSLSSSV